jgi:hypothetical protein
VAVTENNRDLEDPDSFLLSQGDCLGWQPPRMWRNRAPGRLHEQCARRVPNRDRSRLIAPRSIIDKIDLTVSLNDGIVMCLDPITSGGALLNSL